MKTAPRAPWLLVLALLAGCAKTAEGPATAGTGMHHATPPHGGTPVALGDDYRLELVRDAAAGTLSAYVLDDDMEEFIRCPAPAITLTARVGGEDRSIVLRAVPNPATGETVGNTSCFEGQADWVRTADHFAGTLQSLTIRGTPFTGVAFPFPQGNAAD